MKKQSIQSNGSTTLGNKILNKLLLYFFAILLLLAATTELKAQRQLALQWEIPQNQDEAIQQLQRFREIGFTTLEIEQVPSEEVWNQIENSGFTVYGAFPIRFPTLQTFAKPDSQFISTIEQYANFYLQQTSVTAVRLFEYGQITDPEFLEAIQPYVKQIKKLSKGEIKVYAKTARPQSIALPPLDSYTYELQVNAYNFDQLIIPEPTERINGFYYKPSGQVDVLVTPFKNVIEATSAHKNIPVFLESQWVLQILERYPSFASTLSSISTESDPIFPLPDETIPEPEQSTTIPLILLLIWGSFALHYSGSPLYRKSLFRYFTSHSFFVDDIYRRHIRSVLPAFIIIMQNAFLVAICIYALFDVLFTQLGEDALFYHLKWFTFFGYSSFSIFLLAFSIIAILSFLLILWLYFSNKALTNLSQVATLYSWPLQLNLIVATILVPVYIAGGNAFTITVLALFAIVIFLSSFVFASADTVRFMRSKKGLFIFGTAGIYIALLTLVVISLTVSDNFNEVISLAISL